MVICVLEKGYMRTGRVLEDCYMCTGRWLYVYWKSTGRVLYVYWKSQEKGYIRTGRVSFPAPGHRLGICEAPPPAPIRVIFVLNNHSH